MLGTSNGILVARKGAFGRHEEEHLVGLEADIWSPKRKEATPAGPRSPANNAPDPTKRWVLPTRVPTRGIAKPTTDLANLPGRPAFTGFSTSGTEPPPLPPLFSSTPRKTKVGE